ANLRKKEGGGVMYKKITFAVLIASMVGCTFLKERFGTGEDTPELRAARSECRSMAEKEAVAKYQAPIQQKEHIRITFDACMKEKGYNQYGKKVN
ncbi:MAG: hypothetical protein OEY26_09975, partial [Nitrospinota bacterium]|nr:hypothetical protein [Nitrospinota bacterium]